MHRTSIPPSVVTLLVASFVLFAACTKGPAHPSTASPDDASVPDGSACTAADATTCNVGGGGTECKPSIETCILGPCEGKGICAPAGVPCQTSATCPDGASCEPNGGPGVCVQKSVACVDSRTCAFGFACEPSLDFPNDPSQKRCHDRRARCTPGSGQGACPSGYTCALLESSALPFCVRSVNPCPSGASTCIDSAATCGPVLGSGANYCYAMGACLTPDDCSAADAPTCDVNAQTAAAVCGNGGICRSSADCIADVQTCVDVHGDGIKHCRWKAGACNFDWQCAPGALCVNCANADQCPESPDRKITVCITQF